MLVIRKFGFIEGKGVLRFRLLQVRNIHGTGSLLKDKNEEPKSSEEQKISPVDLSSALKHTSKLRVTNQELATLDQEIDLSRTKKISKKYTQDINRNVLSPEVQNAIKTQNTPAPPPTRNLRSKTNSKLLIGFSGKPQPKMPPKRNTLNKHTPYSKSSRSTKPHRAPPLTKEAIEIVSETISVDEDVKQVQQLDKSKIARLAHKLDRTLFSPGVHFLQDPRTRIYNFTPYLKKIIKVDEFNFDAIETFVSVSKDQSLLKVAEQENKKFYSSTSSMTSALMQFYLLLNNYMPNTEERFPFPKFSGAIERVASSVIVQPKGKNSKTDEIIYAVESDKSADTEILLSVMGHCLEALLTTEEKEFERYTLNYKNQEILDIQHKKQMEDEDDKPQNTYNYASYGDFLMRSQLDCYDERLPGNGTFDLKTRAVCAIRYDSGNPELENNTYQIWKLNGNLESFEREYTDLIRTGALLKYSFQARIGQMDGIFVAYHNINSFFGFQYLPLSEIDNTFYNHSRNEITKHIGATSLEDIDDDLPSYVADTQFKMSLEIWEKLLKEIINDINQVEQFEDTAFRLLLKSSRIPGSSKQRMHVMAVPLDKEQVHTLQKFPSTFKTGFKEEISPEERLQNLSRHRDELNDFNKKTTKSDLGVLSYCIDVDHYFGSAKSPVKDLHAYPRSKDQPWKLKYSIKKLPNNPKPYLDLLAATTDMLTSSHKKNLESNHNDDYEFSLNNNDAAQCSDRKKVTDKANVLKVYSAIGKARAEKWEEKDSNPVMYKPNP